MVIALPKIRVGDPVRHESLSVFPLFSEVEGDVKYRLSDEAIADESLLVEEIDESGSVPNLLVENKGDSRVLFLEGEELIGAKQNRVLNTSLLIGARSKVTIPVSCVEAGRWRHRSRYFSPSSSHSPSSLRYTLKDSVSRSTRSGHGHGSDQGAVWGCVGETLSSLNVSSPTDAMSDAHESFAERSAQFHESLKYVDGATGLAVAIGRQIVSLDLFDKRSTCQKVWPRLLSGCILDALPVEAESEQAEASAVEALLVATDAATWEPVRPAGEGEEYRATFDNDHASVLSYKDTLIHGSVVTQH